MNNTQENIQAIKQRFGIIGTSPKINRAIEIAMQVAITDLSVLVTGESGVGKEHFPKIIHQHSPRKHGPYFAINCGAIPEGTVDSELFGKTYDVIFTNGDKLEFDSQGNWLEVECKKSEVPAALVPEAISKFVADSYPQMKILEIDHDRRGYDVKLSNRMELKFDSQYQLVGIDD